MDWSINLEDTPGTIAVIVRGQWDMAEALEVLGSVWAEQARTAVHRVVWDLRELEISDTSTSDLREIANRQLRDRPDLPEARAAIVVSRDLAFGMGRMVEAYLEGAPVDVHVFRDIPEALDWLSGEDDER